MRYGTISHMQRGFSLVELSIVLVILGLLTGGILAGQSLIRAAEVRKYSTQAANYMTAVHTFRDKYFALPGDMANATSFWGRDNTAGTMCAAQPGTALATGTCNGNGAGTISEVGIEIAAAWRHLSLAGLIEGNYDGHYTVPQQPGVNAPATPNGAPWAMFAEGSTLIYGQAINQRTALMTQSSGGVHAFRPEEMWNLDTKMDDGVMSTGAVISLGTGCGDGPMTQTTPQVNYVLTTTDRVCAAYFYLQ